MHKIVDKYHNILVCFIYILSGVEEDPTLELVQIFFDTASFDEIERDEKSNFETQISNIGGTMGLFTGFSIISGIEIIYFAVKIFYNTSGQRLRCTICKK